MSDNIKDELLADIAALNQGHPLRVTEFTKNADGSITETVTFGDSQRVTQLAYTRARA